MYYSFVYVCVCMINLIYHLIIIKMHRTPTKTPTELSNVKKKEKM